MKDATVNKKIMYIRWFVLRLVLVVYDILAVNAAYFLALVVRFYVNSEFNIWAVKYIPAFWSFSPYYTVCCLAVFGFMGLYKSLWKYADLSDMNRIIVSSVITCVIHIVGTLVFVMRMPITYYVLGAAFQFVLIAVSRFSYRLIVLERKKFSKERKHDAVNVLIVGLGESSRTVIKHLNSDPDSMAKPVCILDASNTEFRGTMAGVPILGGIQRMEDAIRDYEVDRVLVADTIVPAEIRTKVKDICKGLEIPVQDFSGFFQSTPRRIPLRTLLEYVDGPVLIEIGDQKIYYDSAKQAIAKTPEKYIVSSLYLLNGNLCIRLIEDVLHPNDVQADWVQSYREETGEDISFF